MPRLPEIDEAKLSPDQRRLYDEIKRVRGQIRGPFAVWLRNPELAEYTLKLRICLPRAFSSNDAWYN